MKINTALSSVVAAFVCFASAGWALTPVLTYNGATKGDWFAAGVWLNESGAAVNWQDGAIAVLTNKEITLTADAVAYGFQVNMTGRYCVYGSGKMTLGMGGIVKTGAGEFNMQNTGGLHLSDSQAWTDPDGGMVCLDGMRPFTAADGVVLTGNGRTVLRMNAGGGLGSNTTIRVTENALFSLSPDGSLGHSVIILDGVGNRLASDFGFVFADSRFGRQLILRNGASMVCGANNTFSLGAITVDAPATQALSSITGAAWTLTRANTTFDVTSDASVQVSLPLLDGSGVVAALSKTGIGTLILNSASTFSGGVTVGEGNVQLLNASGAGSGPVTLASATVLDLAAAGTVANSIAGAGRVVKSGSGTLALAGANSYAGGTSLSDGATRVSTLAGLGSGAVAVNASASLVFTASQTVSASDVARVTGTGTVLAGTGADVVWSGDYAVSGGLILDAELGGTLAVGQLTGSSYTKTGAGKLRIAGTTGYSGEIVVSAGVLDIDSTANLASGVTVRTTGNGIVQLSSLDGQDLAKITGTHAITLKNGAAIAINTDSQTSALTTVTNETWFVSSLTGAADLIKTGAGTLVVSNATAFAGRVIVLQGLLQAVGAIGNNTVTVSNGVFSAYGSGTTLQNNYTVAGGTLATDNGGSLGAGAISLLAGGTLVSTNSGSLGSGDLALGAGTLRMDAGGTAGTRTMTLSGSGLIQVYDGAGFDNATLSIGGGTLDFRATTTMGKGVTLTANTTFSANTPTGASVPTVATLAGSITTAARSKLVVNGNGQLRLAGGGSFVSGGEIFVQGGGDLTIVSNEVVVTGYAGIESGGKRFAVADGGTFSMTGNANLHAGMGAGDCTFEVLTGGVYNVSSGVNLMIGNGCNTLLRIRGGTMNVANGGQFILGNSASIMGTVELAAGGVLKASRQLFTGSGSGSVVFNGGTLQPDGVNSYDPWIAANIAVTVGRAGGTIDAQGLDMKLGSSGIAGPGVLTQMGGGLLRFSQPSTNWFGGLTLAEGTAVASTNSALGLGTVTLETNALRISGNFLLPNAIVAPTNGGIVTVDAGLTGAVATVSGGKLVKQGGGALFVDYVADNSGFSVQGGQVAVTPLDGVPRVPAGVPAIWVDASVAASFVTATSNDVSRWYDRRSPGDANGFFATNIYNRPLVVSNALNGLPVLDFGRLGQGGGSGDNRMLAFKGYQTNIRTVFWVIGSRNGGGFLLGDSRDISGSRHFHRGSWSGTYGGVPSDPLWNSAADKGIVKVGETWTNGVPVDGTTTGLSGDYDLVSWRLSASDDAVNNTPSADWFASCYAPADGRLNGGQELAEVLIYTNRLTDAERKATEIYLNRKWFSTRVGAGLALGSVSLDGAGAGFVNAYTGPVQVAELTVNSTNVFVSGVAGGTAVSQVVVTASGLLGPRVTQALAVRDLEMKEQSALEAAFAADGATPVFALAGNLVLPAAARFMVTGSVKPPPSALLIDVSGTIETPGGTTAWTNAGTESHASSVWVDAVAKEVWLKTPRGTQVILR